MIWCDKKILQMNIEHLSWWRYLSYKNQSTDLQIKSMDDSILYEKDLCQESVKERNEASLLEAAYF